MKRFGVLVLYCFDEQAPALPFPLPFAGLALALALYDLAVMALRRFGRARDPTAPPRTRDLEASSLQ